MSASTSCLCATLWQLFKRVSMRICGKTHSAWQTLCARYTVAKSCSRASSYTPPSQASFSLVADFLMILNTNINTLFISLTSLFYLITNNTTGSAAVVSPRMQVPCPVLVLTTGVYVCVLEWVCASCLCICLCFICLVCGFICRHCDRQADSQGGERKRPGGGEVKQLCAYHHICHSNNNNVTLRQHSNW